MFGFKKAKTEIEKIGQNYIETKKMAKNYLDDGQMYYNDSITIDKFIVQALKKLKKTKHKEFNGKDVRKEIHKHNDKKTQIMRARWVIDQQENLKLYSLEKYKYMKELLIFLDKNGIEEFKVGFKKVKYANVKEYLKDIDKDIKEIKNEITVTV